MYRLYREEQLAVRRRKRRKLVAGARIVLATPTQPNERWSMDFMGDTLAGGRIFRTLNIVDDASRECLAIEVDHGLSGLRVTRVLDRLATRRPLPRRIVVDNGPEFTSTALDAWAYRRSVELHFIRPGKPVDNAFIESFTRTGSLTSRTRAPRSRPGGSTTTRCGPAARSGTAPQRSTPRR